MIRKVFLCLCLFPLHLFAQDFNATRHTLDSIEAVIHSDTNRIVSNETLNKYMASKIAYYLASSNDVSLYKMYAIFTPSDNTAFAGYNFGSTTSDGRVKSLTTLGVNLN